MKKRVLSLVLVLAMLVSMVPATALGTLAATGYRSIGGQNKKMLDKKRRKHYEKSI